MNLTPPPLVDKVVFHLWGTLGVNFFFGLSGFLITTLLVREHRATGGISLKKFYLRRAFRILPPLTLFLLTVIGLNLAGIVRVPWHSVAMSAAFLQNYNFFHFTLYSDDRYIGHLWTLSSEEQFYLLWPFALVALGPKRMRKAALLMALIAPAIRVGHYFLFPAARPKLTVMFHTSYDIFLWGCLLALWSGDPRWEMFLRRFRSVGWFILALCFYLGAGPILDVSVRGIYELTVGMTLRGLCIVFIIAWLGQNPQGWPARFLNTTPMRAVGVLSYSLYIWQQLFLGKGEHTFSSNLGLCIACAFAAACVSYLFLEKPFLELRRRLGSTLVPSRASSEASIVPVAPVQKPADIC